MVPAFSDSARRLYSSSIAAPAAAPQRDAPNPLLATITTLKTLLTQLVAYVENMSGGDAAKIESAGMSVRASTTAPIGPMTQMLDLVLSAGDFEGTLDVVRAIGADNKPGPWSDPATKIVP
jgi:hypothetical protein